MRSAAIQLSRTIVGHDQDFRGAGVEIDAAVARNQRLGCGHKLISRVRQFYPHEEWSWSRRRARRWRAHHPSETAGSHPLQSPPRARPAPDADRRRSPQAPLRLWREWPSSEGKREADGGRPARNSRRGRARSRAVRPPRLERWSRGSLSAPACARPSSNVTRGVTNGAPDRCRSSLGPFANFLSRELDRPSQVVQSSRVSKERPVARPTDARDDLCHALVHPSAPVAVGRPAADRRPRRHSNGRFGSKP